MWCHVVGVALFVAMATAQGQGQGNGMDGRVWEKMISNFSFPDPVELSANLSQYIAVAADTNNNGYIDNNEFYLFLFRGGDQNGDNSVSLAEFMDFQRAHFPELPPEMVAIMFNLLDDLTPDTTVPANFTPSCDPKVGIFSGLSNFGDGALRDSDVTIKAFTGSDNPSRADFGNGLRAWIKEAAMQMWKNKNTPFKVGETFDVYYDYDLFFEQLDTNDDTIITPGELNSLLQKFSATGSVRRQDWATRNTETYGQDRVASMVVFDYLDSNNDQVIDSDDVGQILEWADANNDDRTTKQEMYRFMQRKDNMVRRLLGLPIKPFIYDCPDPVWKDGDDCKAVVDATLITMDTDFDFDGNITVEELKQHIQIMDDDKNGEVDRAEYISFYNERYDQDMAAADIEFDSADMNGDGVFSWDDYEKHFQDEEADWVCACEYRLAAMASARTAEHLAKERKEKMQLLRMKYFVILNNFLSHSTFPGQRQMTGAMAQWRWNTMNGKPSVGGCKKCSARENWGMGDWRDMRDRDDMDDDDEQDWKVMHMVVGALKRMKVMDQWGEEDRSWRMMKMLMHAMRSLNDDNDNADDNTKDNKDDDNNDDNDVNDMAKWMTWKMATMKMEKVKDKMDGWGQGWGERWREQGDDKGRWRGWGDDKKDDDDKGRWRGWGDDKKGGDDKKDDDDKGRWRGWGDDKKDDDDKGRWRGWGDDKKDDDDKGRWRGWGDDKKDDDDDEKNRGGPKGGPLRWNEMKEKKEKADAMREFWKDMKDKWEAKKDKWGDRKDKKDEAMKEMKDKWEQFKSVFGDAKFPWEEADDSAKNETGSGNKTGGKAKVIRDAWWMNWKEGDGQEDAGTGQDAGTGGDAAGQGEMESQFLKWFDDWQQGQKTEKEKGKGWPRWDGWGPNKK